MNDGPMTWRDRLILVNDRLSRAVTYLEQMAEYADERHDSVLALNVNDLFRYIVTARQDIRAALSLPETRSHRCATHDMRLQSTCGWSPDGTYTAMYEVWVCRLCGWTVETTREEEVSR